MPCKRYEVQAKINGAWASVGLFEIHAEAGALQSRPVFRLMDAETGAFVEKMGRAKGLNLIEETKAQVGSEQARVERLNRHHEMMMSHKAAQVEQAKRDQAAEYEKRKLLSNALHQISLMGDPVYCQIAQAALDEMRRIEEAKTVR